MAEFKINIALEKEHLIKLLVEELGGKIIEEKEQTNRAVKTKAKKTSVKKRNEKKLSPTFLFGKWKGFDIDAKKLREETWGRKY